MIYQINKKKFDLSNQSQFYKLIKLLDEHYFNKSKPLILDEEYDRLVAAYKSTFGISVDDTNETDLTSTSKPNKKRSSASSSSSKETNDKSPKRSRKERDYVLPYTMPSLSKLLDSKSLVNWMTKMFEFDENQKLSTSEFLCSSKMDGLSLEIVFNLDLVEDVNELDREFKCIFYSKKTCGRRGRRLDHVRKVLGHRFSSCSNIDAIRGEIILSNTNYEILKQRHPNVEFVNSRTSAAGLVNANVNIDENDLKLLDFVAFRVFFNPDSGPHTQQDEYNILEKLNYLLPDPEKLQLSRSNQKDKTFINNMYLWCEERLKERRTSGKYQQDGLCLYHIRSMIHERSDPLDTSKLKKPEHEIAVKFLGESATAIVDRVEWEPTKGSMLFPTIHFKEPVILEGSENRKCSGKSAQIIRDNHVGPDAKILITKAGGIINEFLKTIEPSPTGAQFSNIDCEYDWNEDETNIFIRDKTGNFDVYIQKAITFFKCFNNHGCEQMGPKRVEQLIRHYGTIQNILENATIESLLELDGIKKKTATTLFQSIQACKTTEISLTIAIVASCVYDRNFNESRLDLILSHFPDIMRWHSQETQRISQLTSLPGIKEKLASQFMSKWDSAKQWLDEFSNLINISYDVLNPTISKPESMERSSDTNTTTTTITFPYPKIVSGTFAFTNIEREPLASFLLKNGASKVDCNVTKKPPVTCLIVESYNDNTEKMKKAVKYGVKMLTVEDFYKEYC